ncbi:hypothetical protein DESC_720050 [Desulfosarcina cetonica]|nr:hypothetical protein DESC_720050 [Desulfosarcina cetonica]
MACILQERNFKLIIHLRHITIIDNPMVKVYFDNLIMLQLASCRVTLLGYCCDQKKRY